MYFSYRWSETLFFSLLNGKCTELKVFHGLLFGNDDMWFLKCQNYSMHMKNAMVKVRMGHVNFGGWKLKIKKKMLPFIEYSYRKYVTLSNKAKNNNLKLLCLYRKISTIKAVFDSVHWSVYLNCVFLFDKNKKTGRNLRKTSNVVISKYLKNLRDSILLSFTFQIHFMNACE